MPGNVPVHIARERNRALRELITGKNLAFRQGFLGQQLEAITLHTNGTGTTEALTNNFVKMTITDQHPSNQIMKVAVIGLTDDGLSGAVAEQL